MFFVYPTFRDEKYVHLVFRPWKLDTLTLPTVKENLNTNLLRTIISSLASKNYYHIVLLFLCYAFPFASNSFVFSLL